MGDTVEVERTDFRLDGPVGFEHDETEQCPRANSLVGREGESLDLIGGPDGHEASWACCPKKEAPVGTSENAISMEVQRTRLVRTPRTNSPSCSLGTWLVSSG